MVNSENFLDWLDDDVNETLISKLAVRTYKREEIVLSESESSCDIFFLLEGRARATSLSEEGKQVAYRDIGPGSVFGELSAIDSAPRSASVIALGPLTAGRMSDEDFRALVDDCPPFCWALLRYLAAQNRKMTARIFEYSTMLARDRLVQELLRMAAEAGGGDGRVVLQPSPTHYDLAMRISTHREAVSREMSKLARQGLVEKQSKTLIIVSVDALRDLRDRREIVD